MPSFNRLWFDIQGEALKLNLLRPNGEIENIDSPILPYCYKRGSGLVSYDKCNVEKVEFKYPYEVKTFSYKADTWESDVQFAVNVMRTLDWRIEKNFSKGHFDIECDDSKGFPTPLRDKIISISLDDMLFQNDDEGILLENFLDEAKKKTMLIGWNSNNFDKPYLEERCKINHLEHSWAELSGQVAFMDLMKLFIKAGSFKKDLRLSSYALDFVSKSTIEDCKIKHDKPLYQLTKKALGEYNAKDTELTTKIDEKFRLTDLEIELASLVYRFPDQLSPLIMADGLLLRESYAKQRPLPNRKSNSTRTPYQGAYVHEPKAGIYENVAVLDTKQMYPNIMINEEIDIFVPDILKGLIKSREQYRALFRETKDMRYDIQQTAYKILSNIFYGSFANPFSRIYNIDKARRITERGRALIRRIIKISQDIQKPTLYSDTDSIFIKCDNSQVQNAINFINSMIAPYSVALANYYKKIVFYERIEGVGAKKRYFGYDSKNKFEVVGLEYIRTDRCNFIRNFQRLLMEAVLNDKTRIEINAIIENEKQKLYRGEYDKELIVYKGLKDGEYKVSTPQFRAFQKAKLLGLQPYGKIGFYWTKMDVEPAIEDKIPSNLDRSRYWDEANGIATRLLSFRERTMKLDEWFGEGK